LIISCSQKKTTLAWQQPFYQIGSQSSPKAADLNTDGVLDIVMGAGTAEMGYAEQAVIALDGRTGVLLWQQEADAHIVGSAVFYDITGDGTNDVFIGGRKHHLMALDGKTGAIIWKYRYQFENDPLLQFARFNFYNSTFVPDQNGDGLMDLLTVNGGNWDAQPGDSSERYPGVLMLLDAVNGSIIAADTMPDGKETYMSPLCFTSPENGELQIIFGTGGETIGGSLYLATLSDLKERQLKRAKVIATETNHGFIAPPVLADITRDGHPDIIAMSHAGHALAVDGSSFQPVWEHRFSHLESSNSFAVGYFNEDDVPDFFTILSKGTWPDYATAVQVLLDGASGNLIYHDSIGCFNLSSPVAYDLDDDGLDEAIFSINDYDCGLQLTEDIRSPASMRMQLLVLDFQTGKQQRIDQAEGYKNMYSTPWLGDLDADGYLDIVYPQYYNPADLFQFMGMTVKRISTGVKMGIAPRWGEYMGTESKGTFMEDGTAQLF
jgi:outer membrane protein assembly factor BamB